MLVKCCQESGAWVLWRSTIISLLLVVYFLFVIQLLHHLLLYVCFLHAQSLRLLFFDYVEHFLCVALSTGAVISIIMLYSKRILQKKFLVMIPCSRHGPMELSYGLFAVAMFELLTTFFIFLSFLFFFF